MKKKITNHDHDKYITTSEFNTLAVRAFNARNLIIKTDFDTRLQSLNKRITSNKIKHLLIENELKKKFMQSILEAKIILMVMALKII